MNFPDLAEGGVSVAVTVNNVLQGRKAAAELASLVLSHYGYRPGWTQIPLRVTIETGRILAESKMAQSLLKQMLQEGNDENNRKRASCASGCLSLAASSCKCCSA